MQFKLFLIWFVNKNTLPYMLNEKNNLWPFSKKCEKLKIKIFEK